jgi:hypothetical protein
MISPLRPDIKATLPDKTLPPRAKNRHFGPDTGAAARAARHSDQDLEDSMADTKTIKVEHGYGGLWYVGWLFTVALAQLPVGKALLGLIIWPWYLGVALR